jgi:nicotinate-nucleotide pyrophosphorylase (carboxylating)
MSVSSPDPSAAASPAVDHDDHDPAAAPGFGDPGPRRGPVDPPDAALIDRVLAVALAEDRGGGDITSDTAVPEKARARARLLVKEAGVIAGLPVFERAFRLCDPAALIELAGRDGERVPAGVELARVEGRARSLLLAERSALNLLQHLSGVATRTARLVELAAGRVRILDTRKTTPGLRALEKYAVRCGGGENHRFGLDDQVLLKENHLALAGRPLAEVLREQRRILGPTMIITAEARTREEALAAVDGDADVVLLDNMSVETRAALCPALRARAAARPRALEIEASGGIDENSLARVAESGVDRVSIGSLTHSAPALDLSLILEPAP